MCLACRHRGSHRADSRRRNPNRGSPVAARSHSEYEKSRSWMESAADIVIDSTDLPVAEVAERIAIEVDQHIARTSLS